MSEYGLRDGECIWVHRMVIDEDDGFMPHRHPMTQLVWAEHGQLAVISGGRRWVLAPTQALWIPADEPHEIRVLRGSELYVAYLWDEEIDVAWSGLTALGMSALARELVRHLARDDLDDGNARHARATLLSVLVPVEAAELDLPLPRNEPARYIAAAMMKEPELPHRIVDWAHRMHTSEKTIQRMFQADTGMTFSEWRTQVRLFRALPLLADDMPVGAVASLVGYTSPNGFTSAFRQHFGTTPGAYFTP